MFHCGHQLECQLACIASGKNSVADFDVFDARKIQSVLVIRTMFVSLCFFEENVLITSRPYECSYNQKNYLVF